MSPAINGIATAFFDKSNHSEVMAIEANYPTPKEVASRAFALEEFVCHFIGLGLPARQGKITDLDTLDSLAASKTAELIKRARTEGFWEHFSPWEQGVLQKKYSQLSEDEIHSADGGREALVALIFALQVISRLPPFDHPAEGPVLILLPGTVEPFASNASLRPREELELVREVAARWHLRHEWWLIAEDARRGDDETRNKVDAAIRIIAESATAQGYLLESIRGDFPAMGKAYRELTEQEARKVGSITEERLRAFNWICGRAPGNRWDEAPLE